MQVKTTHNSTTEATILVITAPDELSIVKQQVLIKLKPSVKLPGFRPGNVPESVLEKNIDQTVLQNEFLETAIEQFYVQAVRDNKLRPVGRPEITVKKFVPFTTLEFEAKMPVIGNLKIADYKKIKLKRPTVSITDKDVVEVIKSLQNQVSEKKDVDRPAKKGDQVWIDFKGVDSKGVAVNGAEGKDYPLILGSNAFIPGFEDNVIGLKAGEEKTFDLKFPADYAVKALANKNVKFTVNVTKIQEVVLPEVDDKFAAKIGPFKSVADLKIDIKKQVAIERQRESDRQYENDLIKAISDKSSVDIPQVLIDDQIDRIEQEERQNLTYRGQTWQEHLDEEGINAKQHREQKHPQAVERLKASLLLAEIAEAEKLDVTPEELEIRMQLLKGQYQDAAMQSELDKPEARRDVAGRILTEKTIEKLVQYATK